MINSWIRKVVDFYLYSSIHIALGAALSILLCYGIFVEIPTSDYAIFVFFSTLFIYCAHRIVGIQKVKQFENEGRFAVIKKYKLHLVLYTVLGGIAAGYFYLNLASKIKLYLILPGIISLLYVLPIFSKNKRLRDFDHIKIYLIAIIWGLVIGWIPYIEIKGTFDFKGLLFFLEKTVFIFAITIPFDIRDLKVDENIKVSTIPSRIGAHKSYQLSVLTLIVCIVIVAILSYFQVYNLKTGLALSVGYLITIGLVLLSKGKTDDYYYSGLLDATIILVACLGIYASGILNLLF